MPAIANIEDLRAIARRKMPKVLFDYVDRGSYDEITLNANTDELRAIRFRQRVLVDAPTRSLSVTLLGEELALPYAIAPTGLSGFMHGDGEILAARAAHAMGTQFCLSTMSVCSIEDVREAVKKPFWFQLYVFRDRKVAQSLIERAAAAQCPALFVTVDLPVNGQRHQDVRNGLTAPPKLTPRNILDIATKPGWVRGVMGGKRKTFGNVARYVDGGDNVGSAGRWSTEHFDPTLNWRDIDWIRKLWTGKLVIKGILDVEDARTAVSAGADGIVVSNHGGRQLDGAPSTISLLPDIADAVGDKLEVIFDGGVRSGQDVLKAMALGARGCLTGRAHLYGLAAMGEKGVTLALDIIRRELDTTMLLTGTRDVRTVTADILHGYPPARAPGSNRA